MNTNFSQSSAYELAKYLDNIGWDKQIESWELFDESANMLRQQADRIAELEKHCLDEITKRVYADQTTKVVEKLLTEEIERLEKQSKPVAWVLLNKNNSPIDLIEELTEDDLKDEFADYIPLYTTSQTKPLSDEEIEDLLRQSIWALGLNTDGVDDEEWTEGVAKFRAIERKVRGQ